MSGLSLLPIAESFGIMVPVAHAALLMVLAGAAALAFAFLIAVLPGGGQRLGRCLH
ncbi:hypothetical protein D779_3768 [Imhoffiella purpurea]|uniref:Uncharacterized protein n=1 Tax=Imhoffiella purpurea TaxID=1249627 RepID=W9VBG9_9GAMM|nr:hypothetical protein D779_3768 [Imhoffiella purpurea]